MIVVSMLEERIQVAEGRPGTRPTVRRLHSVSYDRLSESGWEEALSTLWREAALSRRDITLILPREGVVTRVLTLPDMPSKQFAQAVQHEMRLSEEDEMITDYLPLGRDGNLCTVLGGACRKETLARYIQGFDRLGLRLGRISVPMEPLLKLLPAMEGMKAQTCLWLVFDGGGVMSLLAEKGAYRYAGRSRINAPPGTEEFCEEVKRIVSGTMQFQETKRRASAITHVYFAGCEEFAACLPALQDLGLVAQPLPACGRFRALPEGQHLGDWAFCLGAFLRL